MTSWWLSRAPGAIEGPFTTQLLVHGVSTNQIPERAYVCRVGDQRWVRVSQVDEFRNVTRLERQTPRVDEPPFPNVNEAQRQTENVHQSGCLNDDCENEETQVITPLPTDSSISASLPNATPPSPESGGSISSVHSPFTRSTGLSAPNAGLSVVQSISSSFTGTANNLQPASPNLLPRLPTVPAKPILALPTPPYGFQPFNGVDTQHSVTDYLPEQTQPEHTSTHSSISNKRDTSLIVKPKVPTLKGLTAPHIARQSTDIASGTRTATTECTFTTTVVTDSRPSSATDENPIKDKAHPLSPATLAISRVHEIDGETTSSTQAKPVVRAFNGIGQNHAPHVGRNNGTIPGLSSLPKAPLNGDRTTPSTGLTTPDGNTRIGRDDTVSTTHNTNAARQLLGTITTHVSVPPILSSVPSTIQRAEPNSDVQLPQQDGELTLPNEQENLLDETDADAVTAIVSPTQLPNATLLVSEYDDGVTSVVYNEQFSSRSKRSSFSPNSRYSSTESVSLPNVDVATDSSTRNRTHTGRSESQTATAPVDTLMVARNGSLSSVDANAIDPPSSGQTTNRETSTNASIRTSVVHSQPVVTPNPDVSSALVSDPSELLEEDVDDTSIPFRVIPRVALLNAPTTQRKKTTNVSTSRHIQSSEMSALRIATHQIVSPSDLTPSDYTIRQEATKPALRAYRRPGTVQITYGTFIIGILGVALFLLSLVLLLR
jgi:hypothetical protein